MVTDISSSNGTGQRTTCDINITYPPSEISSQAQNTSISLLPSPVARHPEKKTAAHNLGKMKFSLTSIAAFAAFTTAMPSSQQRAVDPVYGPSNPVLDSICPAPTERPLTGLFPFANLLGSIVNPILAGLVGQDTIEFLEYVRDPSAIFALVVIVILMYLVPFSDVAGVLCIATLLDPSICRKALGAIRDFVDETTPLTQSEQFGCLLDYLCVAHAGPANEGTCNLLLESAGTCSWSLLPCSPWSDPC